MYIPKAFAEDDIAIMQQLIKDNPLATLINQTHEGLNANHIPLLWVEGEGNGRLVGHVAKANPVWQMVTSESEVLAVFQGANSYITPSWYVTKQQHHKEVPTWNYMAVHVYGKLAVIEDPLLIKQHLTQMVNQQEQAFTNSWQLTDAPEDYIAKRIEAIVVIELTISRFLAKWKVSQDKGVNNQQSVVAGLTAQGTDNALIMAEQVAKKINS